MKKKNHPVFYLHILLKAAGQPHHRTQSSGDLSVSHRENVEHRVVVIPEIPTAHNAFL